MSKKRFLDPKLSAKEVTEAIQELIPSKRRGKLSQPKRREDLNRFFSIPSDFVVIRNATTLDFEGVLRNSRRKIAGMN